MKVFIHNSIFRQLSINRWVSALGDTFFYLALINYLSAYSFAPMGILLVTISETIPPLLGFFLGALADLQEHRVRKMLFIAAIKVALYALVAILLASQSFSLLILSVICLINLISDSLGYLAGGMISPIYRRVISDQINEAMSFAQATATVVGLLGNFLGGFLLTMMSIEQLATINALTFLFVFLGLVFIRQKLQVFEQEMRQERTFSCKSYALHLGQSIRQLLSMNLVLKLIGTSIVDNVIINSVPALLALILLDNSFFQLTLGQVLSFYLFAMMLSMVVGNFLSSYFTSKISLKGLIIASQLLSYLIILGYLYQNPWLVMLPSLACSFVNGLTSPRVRSLMWQAIPEETLGAVDAAINLIDLALPSLLTLVVVYLATRVNLICSIALMLVFLLAASYLTLKIRTYDS